MPQERGYNRVDATARYTTELKELLRKLYPALSLNNLGDLQTGALTFGSIDTRNSQIVFMREALGVAFSRAADGTPGNAAFCTHGAEGHVVFTEAVEVLQQQLADGGKVALRMTTRQREIHQNSAAGSVAVERFVLTGEPYLRRSVRPRHLDSADSLRNLDLPENARNKKLRDIAREEGVGSALLVATTLGLTQDEIFTLFRNQQFNTEHLKGSKVPTANRPGDAAFLTKLADAMVVRTPSGVHPVRTAESHRLALEMLVNEKFATPEQIVGPQYSMSVTNNNAIPVAVFRGMTEMAQKHADQNYRDPARTEHIDREYGGVMTTNMATAYLVIEPIPEE